MMTETETKQNRNPIVGLRKVVDEEISKRFESREQLESTSKVLVGILGAASSFILFKIIFGGLTLKSMWFPCLVLLAFWYLAYRMHVNWVGGAIKDHNDNDGEQ